MPVIKAGDVKASRGLGSKHNVDPIIRRLVGLARKGIGGAIGIHAVATARRIRWSGERAICNGVVEVTVIFRIHAAGGLMGGDVCCSSGNADRGREIHLLPARRGLVGEGRAAEQIAQRNSIDRRYACRCSEVP